ncbi:MAG TPA: serine/threonine-protein kinase [Schlesneria sp.]
MNSGCPSDEVLRGILQNSDQETRSTEWLSHMMTCRDCQDRISNWRQQSQFEALIQSAADYEISYKMPPENGEISPVRDVTPGEPDGVTNNYQDPPLRRIGNYELLALIGTGGSGNVFRARHIHLGRDAAVKLLLPQYSGSRVARLRFFGEMKSIGRLDHPYIVHADDAGEYEQTLYLAMELVVGENVDSFARRLGPLPVPDACEIIRQASIGLQHIHENGLVHRDLKPSNLLLSKNGVKITDLGLALLIREVKNDHRLTGTETVLGTTDYMAPEQAEGSHEVDIRADLYSLGCTLYRLLAGRPPFSGAAYDTALKKMVAHASHPIPNIQQWRVDVSLELAAIIQRLMSKDRNNRYATPIELAHKLEPFCGDLDLVKLGITAPIQPHLPRSATFKEKTDPVKDSATQIIPSDDPAVPRYIIQHRWVMIGIIGLVALILMLSVREFTREPAIERDPLVLQVAQGPEHAKEDAIANNAPNPAPAPPPVQPIGVVETRWRSKFGNDMKVLRWPGWRPDGAEVRFSDELQGLSIQTDNILRLFQLGVLGEDEVVTLSVKVKSLGRDSNFGIFTGFKIEDKDRPQLAWFHQANVLLPNSGRDYLSVYRLRGFTTAENGARAGTTATDPYTRSVSPDLNQIDLKVVLRPNAVPIIYVDSKECIFRERMFKDPPFTGPFGICVQTGTLLFQDPQITRSSK